MTRRRSKPPAKRIVRADSRRIRVSIVGRPNVGKSTLFNRLLGRRRAITLDQPGITRDPIMEPVEWEGLGLDLVDTGGLRGEADILLADRVHEHTVRAIGVSDLLVVLFDSRAGLGPLDRETVDLVIRSGLPAVYVANKGEGRAAEEGAFEFCALGIDAPLVISAEHGVGISELRDQIEQAAEKILDHERALAEAAEAAAAVELAKAEIERAKVAPKEFATTADATDLEDDLEDNEAQDEDGDEFDDDGDDTEAPLYGEDDGDFEFYPGDEDFGDSDGEAEGNDDEVRPCRVALVGRPNVGKSSFLNLLAGQELSLVDNRPGTTRDVVDTEIERGGRRYVLLDTAGMRRPSRVEEGVERISVRRALEAIERADVVVVIVEPEEGVTDQDARIARHAWEEGRALVLLVNKSDLVRESDLVRVENNIRDGYPTLSPVPVQRMSVLRNRGIDDAFALIDQAYESHNRRITTPDVNRMIAETLRRREPPVVGRGRVKMFYGTQTSVRPPTISIFTNRIALPEDYQRFLERCFREMIDFTGSPLRLRFVRRDSHGSRDPGFAPPREKTGRDRRGMKSRSGPSPTKPPKPPKGKKATEGGATKTVGEKPASKQAPKPRKK